MKEAWLAQLTGEVALPEWHGAATTHLLLSSGDVEDEEAPPAPQADKTPAPLPTRKTCTKCLKTMPATAEYFYRAKREKCGLMCECKECHVARQRDARHRMAAAPRVLSAQEMQMLAGNAG